MAEAQIAVDPNPILPGSVVYHKLTDEPLYVLDVVPQQECLYPHIDPVQVTVRRPIATRDGLAYEVCNFFIGEVETMSQKNNRMSQEVIDREHAIRKVQQSIAPVVSEGRPN